MTKHLVVPIYSDTHLNFTFPWTQYNFVSLVRDINPTGLILTGDIACGLTIKYFLRLFVKQLKIPIYFILGNHDFYSRSFAEITKEIEHLCSKYPNLKWMTKESHLALNEEVGIIGEDGWYDGQVGNPIFLAYNLDWVMIEDFRKLSSFDEKFAFGKKISEQATANLKKKLLSALQHYRTVYILTHVPPWKEATRGTGSGLEEFWKPYNTNSSMGQMIEEVMANHKDQNVINIAGHTHQPAIIHVSHNIECIVQPGKYLGAPSEHNTLYI